MLGYWMSSLLTGRAGGRCGEATGVIRPLDRYRVAHLERDRYRPLLALIPRLCHGRLMAADEYVKSDRQLAARCAAIASLGAGVIHVAVTPMHWRDWVPSGIFFAGLAAFQLLWAVLAWFRPASLALAAGVGANAVVSVLWIMSCIAGPPVGPSVGQPETVGGAGIAVLLLQCYVVMGSAWALSRRWRTQEVSRFRRALVLVGANTVMACAVMVGLVAGLQSDHHRHGGVVEAEGGQHATLQPSEPAGGLPITDMSGVVPPAATPVPPAVAVEADGHRHHDH